MDATLLISVEIAQRLEQARLFFQPVAQRYERSLMILPSNLAFGGSDGAQARAIMTG